MSPDPLQEMAACPLKPFCPHEMHVPLCAVNRSTEYRRVFARIPELKHAAIGS